MELGGPRDGESARSEWERRPEWPEEPEDPEQRVDPAGRRFLVDGFVDGFLAAVTWQATLAVLDGAFHGLRMAGLVGRDVRDLSLAAHGLEGGATASAGGIPVWADGHSLVLDLSAWLPAAGLVSAQAGRRSPAGGPVLAAVTGDRLRTRGRVWRPYAGVLVVDTLHAGLFPRPAAGPRPPWDHPTDAIAPHPTAGAEPPTYEEPLPGGLPVRGDPPSGGGGLRGEPPSGGSGGLGGSGGSGGLGGSGGSAGRGEEDDVAGVVIVTDLSSSGVRILDATILWRHACRIVSEALHDVRRPGTLMYARRALRTLRHAVLLDPALKLGVCLHLDAGRKPWCVLTLAVDESAVTDGEAVRFFRP